MGLLNMIKKDKEARAKEKPEPGPTVGGFLSGSINKAVREHEEQEAIPYAVSEIRMVDAYDEVFAANHIFMGYGSDGMPIFKRRK